VPVKQATEAPKYKLRHDGFAMAQSGRQRQLQRTRLQLHGKRSRHGVFVWFGYLTKRLNVVKSAREFEVVDVMES
jgi:hypothetical protein